MGILTNPDGMPQKTKYVAFLIKYKSVVCNFLFICGIVWFGCLSDLSLNHGTYFSENALLPEQKYWAKDIIFLVTDQEQLGMQAWLDGYYGRDDNTALNSGSLEARAGAIQAAINLEIQSFDIDYINVKLEGLNGQLPNLDLVNLVQKLANKEGISCGYKMVNTRRHLASQSRWKNIEKMLSMVLTQSSGVPTGNHGLFHRFGVEAVTLEAIHRQQSQNAGISIHSLLKIVEGISRSLNNLLEKFHQSFFFYLLVANDRFVSIGDYMPCVGLMAGSLLIKAFIVWLELNQKEEENEKNSNRSFDLIRVGMILIASHALGFLAINAPFFSIFNDILKAFSLPTETVLFYQFVIISLLGFSISIFLPLKSNFDLEVLHIMALLELGTILVVVSMLNFSLGFLACVVTVPLAGNLCTFRNRLRPIKKLFLLLTHPIIISFLIVTILTKSQYPELVPMELLYRSFTATKNAFVFSVVDSVIYGNWIFNLMSLIFLPIWILFWNVISTTPQLVNSKLKQN